ncbi:phage tail length tape measure family protein [Phyllobacterium lublinensis]|uniref:phage tail length tape measure family protein n=1 Tax=Phyllobacterium lublinensis TaxID=2875708 RepID=UPI001CCD38CA|nr:phage tail length tape measure family protein [Phyllobacterium sp. 2063]MBZ9653550.1 phage tail length tape measure family protein [Phyllobacterium sp. 2063]
MADETANRLLVRIEASQARFEKQMAAIAKSAAGGADKIEHSFKRANDNAAKSVGATRAAVSNLSFQLNDIAQGLASGTSPFTIMVQQGSQVTQALQGAGGGVVGAVKALGGAFTTMLNPVSLATFALIGLGGAAIQWLTSTGDKLPDVQKLLEEHARLISEIEKAYGGAKLANTDYTETARANLDKQIADQNKALDAARKAAEKQVQQQTQTATPTLTGFEFSGVAERFKPFEDAIVRLNQQIKEGKPDYDAFYASIRKIAEGDNTGKLEGLRQQLIGITSDAASATQAISQQASSVSNSQIAYGQLADAIKNIDAGTARGELERLEVQAKAGTTTIAQIEQTLRELSHANPDMSGPLGALQRLFDAAIKTNEAIANINRDGMGGRITGPQPLKDLNFSQRFGFDVPGLDAANKKIDREAKPKREKKDREDEYERFTRRLREQTAATEEEYNAQSQLNPLIDDYGYAMEAARLYQEGLNAAKQAGLNLSPAEQEALKQTTDGLAALRAEQERLSEEQGKVKQSFQDWNNTAKDAVGGLISDLTSGKSAAESFANALKKIADQLIEVSLNSLFDPKGGLIGSSGGGFNLLSLFGLGASSGIPAFASGTNNAPGGLALVGERGPELVNLPKGSQVIPSVPSMKALGRGGAVNVTYAPQNNFQGTSAELAQFRREQLRDRQEFSARVVDTVRRAQKTRNLKK